MCEWANWLDEGGLTTLMWLCRSCVDVCTSGKTLDVPFKRTCVKSTTAWMCQHHQFNVWVHGRKAFQSSLKNYCLIFVCTYSYILRWTILKNVREHWPSISHTFWHPSMIFCCFPAYFACHLIIVNLTLFQRTSYPFRTVLYTYQTCLCSFPMFSKIFPFTACAILSFCTVIYVLFIMGLYIVMDKNGPTWLVWLLNIQFQLA
jgi:hypothetical protein